MDIYNKSTWLCLATERQRLRDKIFDYSDNDLATLAALESALEEVEQRIRQGETHEFPW